jgi:hypothetical protein
VAAEVAAVANDMAYEVPPALLVRAIGGKREPPNPLLFPLECE